MALARFCWLALRPTCAFSKRRSICWPKGIACTWPSTRSALGAVGLSMLIELAAGLLAAVTWLLGAVLV